MKSGAQRSHSKISRNFERLYKFAIVPPRRESARARRRFSATSLNVTYDTTASAVVIVVSSEPDSTKFSRFAFGFTRLIALCKSARKT